MTFVSFYIHEGGNNDDLTVEKLIHCCYFLPIENINWSFTLYSSHSNSNRSKYYPNVVPPPTIQRHLSIRTYTLRDEVKTKCANQDRKSQLNYIHFSIFPESYNFRMQTEQNIFCPLLHNNLSSLL